MYIFGGGGATLAPGCFPAREVEGGGGAPKEGELDVGDVGAEVEGGGGTGEEIEEVERLFAKSEEAIFPVAGVALARPLDLEITFGSIQIRT